MKSASKITLSALAKHVLDAALTGARAARKAQIEGLHPAQKSEDANDLVTEGDEAAQQAILSILPSTLHSIKGHEPIGVLAEEKGAKDTPSARWRWVIDPIDGTLPYSKGEAFWCVSVALQEKPADGTWVSRLGVVYQASALDTAEQLHGKLFWAQQDVGAFVLDLTTNMQIPLNRPTDILPEAEISASGAFGAWANEELARRDIAMRFRRSICHAITEMLLGRKCAVVQDAGPMEWDVAAILLIAQQAGAFTLAHHVDKVAGCNRYATLLAWDEELFAAFSRRLPSSIPG